MTDVLAYCAAGYHETMEEVEVIGGVACCPRHRPRDEDPVYEKQYPVLGRAVHEEE